MNQIEQGKLIAELRKKSGYTQASLAAALFVTDKAVSKWERGICSPDNSLLPKLAGLLDTDLATLLPDSRKKTEWKGLLIIDEGETGATTLINNRPLIHYLLSYFLLLEITDVAIITDDITVVREMNLSRYGFNISFTPFNSEKTMVVYGKNLLFGAYFTQQLLNIMAANENAVPVIGNVTVPMLFLHHIFSDYKQALEKAKFRSLYRGMVNIPLDSTENVKDAEAFINLYEKYHGVKYCDLAEIARNRGFI